MQRYDREARVRTSEVMSPDGTHKPSPRVYKFTAEQPPATDGLGDLTHFKRVVLDWCALHDQLLLKEAKKKVALIKPERGLALKGQLSGPAWAKVNTIPLSDLVSDLGLTKLLDVLVTETAAVTAVCRSRRVTALLKLTLNEKESLADFMVKFVVEHCR
jgi:hypothetical protein